MIVHLVTDRRRLAGSASIGDALTCVLTQVRYAVEAGVDCIQIRERDLEAKALTELSAAAVAATRGTRTVVVVNDRIDVAIASGADGVHLRGDSISVDAARRMSPKGFLIGRSVHGVDDMTDAAAADYVIAGTVWPTESKTASHRLIGVEGLRAIAAATAVPVLAIGGVTLDRVADIAVARGAGIAAIGLFVNVAMREGCGAGPLREIVTSMRRRFDTSGSAS